MLPGLCPLCRPDMNAGATSAAMPKCSRNSHPCNQVNNIHNLQAMGRAVGREGLQALERLLQARAAGGVEQLMQAVRRLAPPGGSRVRFPETGAPRELTVSALQLLQAVGSLALPADVTHGFPHVCQLSSPKPPTPTPL